jgi:branched-chain amino acid transport system substrate-binding protein
MRKRLFAALITATFMVTGAAHALDTPPGPDSDKQFFPLATYRIGPYASSGTSIWAGQIDYFRYINEVEGGINGVKIDWKECETEWTTEKGIECYERLKHGDNGAPAAAFFPAGAGYQAIAERAGKDQIPLVEIAYGQTEAINGSIFPYVFPIMLTAYSEASAFVSYIAQREGGFDKLKGKTIATVYIDEPPGRETIEPMAALAEKYGFKDIQIPIAEPGNEQSSLWRQVREAKPDWIFLRTWGVSTPVGIKTATRFGFHADRIVADVWAASEEDVIPAGEAAKGYMGLTPFPAGKDFDIHKRLKKYIIDAGKSDLRDLSKFGSHNYNAGLVNGLIAVETVRQAQAKFGNRPITGAEAQWALEHLKLDDAILQKTGFLGLSQNLQLTPQDHEGGGAARVQQWDGAKWTVISDWIRADHELLRPLEDAKSAAWAKSHGVAPQSN